MALAFRGVHLPFVQRRKRTRIPSICCADAPQATRHSLPTYRERRFLEDNYVERAKGRPAHFARTTAFTMTAWPLVVRDLTPEEADRRKSWMKKQRGTQNVVNNQEQESVDAGKGSKETLIPANEAGDIAIPDLGCEMLLEISHDSLLLDTEELEEDKLLRQASKWDFTIPPWAYIVRVRASKAVIGKRAVQRNRAKRRIRAAASAICPDHASRGREYVFSANPEALTIGYEDLVDEVCMALKRGGCWEDEMTIEMLRREKYCGR